MKTPRAGIATVGWLAATALLFLPTLPGGAAAQALPEPTPTPTQALPAPTPAAAEKTPYEQAIEEAVSEFGAGLWDEAYISFKRAYELQPGPRPMRGMGKALYERRSYAEAVFTLQQALEYKDTERPLTAGQRADVEHWLEKARMYIAEVHLVVKPEDATVYVNGAKTDQRAFILNSGSYQLMATHPDYKELRQDLKVNLGTKQTINLILASKTPVVAAVAPPLPPPAAPAAQTQPPKPQEAPPAQPAPAPEPAQQEVATTVADDGVSGYSVTAWILFTAGTIALTTGAVMAALNAAEFKTLDKQCANLECTEEDITRVQDGIDASNLSNGLMFGGGGALAVAVGLWMFAPEDNETASLEVLPACGVARCGLVARGSF